MDPSTYGLHRGWTAGLCGVMMRELPKPRHTEPEVYEPGPSLSVRAATGNAELGLS